MLAQDLAGEEPIDITSHVEFKGVSLYLNGRTLREAGLRNGSPGDLSSPGAIVALV